MTEPVEIAAPVKYKPTKIEQISMWLVGPQPRDHYTKADIQHITVAAPLMVLISASAGGAAALAASVFAGVTLIPAIGAGAFYSLIIGALDRTIMGAESRKRAEAEVNKLVRPGPKGFLPFIGHALHLIPRHLALVSRLGIALAAGTVVSKTVITTSLFRDEISKVFENHFQIANKGTIKYNQDIKETYDKDTASLKTQLTQENMRLAQQQDSFRTISSPFDNTPFNTKIDALAQQQHDLENQLAAEKKAQIQFKTDMDAETAGVKLGNKNTGKPGQGTAWKTAQLQFEQSTRLSTGLEDQIKAVKTSIQAVKAEMEKAVARADATHDESASNLDGTIKGLTANIKALTEQIRNRDTDRNSYFTRLDEQMAKDPNFAVRENGLLSSLSALDEILGKPENQGTPRLMFWAMLALLIGLETSPVFAAAMRRPTGSELKSAFDDLMAEVKSTKIAKHEITKEYPEIKALTVTEPKKVLPPPPVMY